MTEDQLPEDAPEPENWLMKFAALVPTLGMDEDILVLNEMVGVDVRLGDVVDLNERVFDGELCDVGERP